MGVVVAEIDSETARDVGGQRHGGQEAMRVVLNERLQLGKRSSPIGGVAVPIGCHTGWSSGR